MFYCSSVPLCSTTAGYFEKGIDIIEEPLPLENIELKLLLPNTPKRVFKISDAQSVDFTYEAGKLFLKIDQVIGYEMLVIEC